MYVGFCKMTALDHIDTTLLVPDFLQKLTGLLLACQAHGQQYRATFGFRSLQLQDELHQKYLAGGPRAAPAGQSAHNYGCAVDLERLNPDGSADWAVSDYQFLDDMAPRFGLQSLASVQDYGHIELQNWEQYRTQSTDFSDVVSGVSSTTG
jgi:hypothetical protein